MTFVTKISWGWDFWWLRKMWTDTHTFYKYIFRPQIDYLKILQWYNLLPFYHLVFPPAEPTLLCQHWGYHLTSLPWFTFLTDRPMWQSLYSMGHARTCCQVYQNALYLAKSERHRMWLLPSPVRKLQKRLLLLVLYYNLCHIMTCWLYCSTSYITIPNESIDVMKSTHTFFVALVKSPICSVEVASMKLL